MLISPGWHIHTGPKKKKKKRLKSSLKLGLSLCQHGLMKSRLVGKKVQTWFGRLSPLRRSRYFIVHRLSLREKKKNQARFSNWIQKLYDGLEVMLLVQMWSGDFRSSLVTGTTIAYRGVWWLKQRGRGSRTVQLHTHSYTRTARLQQLCFAKVDSDAETEFEKLRGEGCSFPGPLNEAHRLLSTHW